MTLRRSSHFVPGANEKMLQKSIDGAADSLILDLEDAVTPENKASARTTVAGWLRDADFRGKERVVRMNPIATEWGRADVEETMAHPPDAYLVPKVNSADELHELDRRILDEERRYGHRPRSVALLILGTETPLGTLNIRELPFCPRVDALTWGAEDLAAAIGARRNRDTAGNYLDVFAYGRVMTLLAATAARVQPLDTVFVDFRNLGALERECEEAAAVGFTGKMTIHPSQIDIVNRAFSPTEAEIAESQELLALAAEKRAEGLQAFTFRGQMVDVPHIARAERMLAFAEELNKLGV